MLSAADAGVPIATMRLYLDAVSPFKLEEFSKNAYINNCIEELYLQMEGKLQAKMDNITSMKKQIEKLDELQEMLEMFGEGEVDPS